jgi:hypothetical protein
VAQTLANRIRFLARGRLIEARFRSGFSMIPHRRASRSFGMRGDVDERDIDSGKPISPRPFFR